MRLARNVFPALLLLGIGQFSFASWEPTHLTGGRVAALALSPNNPKRVYAATGLGLYESDDGGETWKAKVLAYDASGHIDFIPAVAVGADAAGGAYVATARGLFASRAHENRFRRRRMNNDAIDRARLIGVIAFPSGAVVAASEKAIARSMDQGETWTVVPAETQLGRLRSIAAGRDGAIYVASDKGAFRAKWPADDWQAITPANVRGVDRIDFGVASEPIAIVEREESAFLFCPDGWDNWQTAAGVKVTSTSALATLGGAVYVGGPAGLSRIDWPTKKSSSIATPFTADILSILPSTDGASLLVGTAGKGVWRLRLLDAH